jgi:hypothetical protein
MVARVPIRLVIVPLVAVRVVELNEVEVEWVVAKVGLSYGAARGGILTA